MAHSLLKASVILAILALSTHLCHCKPERLLEDALDDDFEYLDANDEYVQIDDFTVNRETECSHFCYSSGDKCCGYSSSLWGTFCRNGRAQSPINLPLCKGAKAPSPPLAIDGDQYKGKFSMNNDGHAVVLNFLDTKTVNISGAGTYILDNVRFHWGDDDNAGSEHCVKRVSGQGCVKESMELQLVHYKSDKNDLQSAIESGQRNAVLVISLLLRVPNSVSKKDDDAKNPLLPVLNPVIKQLDEVTSSGESTTVKHTFDLMPWMSVPNMASSYFGSMTTPACKQVVRWYVLQTPMLVKAADIAAFRSLKQANGQPILSNRRPMQKRNKREIQCYQLKVKNLTPTAEVRDPTYF